MGQRLRFSRREGIFYLFSPACVFGNNYQLSGCKYQEFLVSWGERYRSEVSELCFHHGR